MGLGRGARHACVAHLKMATSLDSPRVDLGCAVCGLGTAMMMMAEMNSTELVTPSTMPVNGIQVTAGPMVSLFPRRHQDTPSA